MPVEIKTADELVAAGLEARWAARRTDPWADVLPGIYRVLLEREGSIPRDEIERVLPGRARETVREALSALDADDLITLEDLRAWRVAHPEEAGAATTIAEAFTLGRRIFGGLLVNPTPGHGGRGPWPTAR